jgi:hypothetical protein
MICFCQKVVLVERRRVKEGVIDERAAKSVNDECG